MKLINITKFRKLEYTYSNWERPMNAANITKKFYIATKILVIDSLLAGELNCHQCNDIVAEQSPDPTSTNSYSLKDSNYVTIPQ